MDTETLTQLAEKIAHQAHLNQKRKDGKPYISHPKAVVAKAVYILQILSRYYPAVDDDFNKLEPLIKQLAWLHDTVEDTDLTIKDIESHGFSNEVIYGLKLVTMRKGENYFNFISRIADSSSIVAIIVKVADLEHNLSDLTEGFMKDKYRFARDKLNSRLYATLDKTND